jgi:hypothetical protein
MTARTSVFSRGSKRLVVRPGGLMCSATSTGDEYLADLYPLSITSRRGSCTLAVLSNMRGLVNELRQ